MYDCYAILSTHIVKKKKWVALFENIDINCEVFTQSNIVEKLCLIASELRMNLEH